MDWIVDVDWRKTFVPDRALLEIVIRGTIVYLALLALLRLVLKRQSSGVGVTDLLLVVLIADAAQNALAGDYTAIPDGVLLVGVIIFWAWFLDWLGFRFPAVQRLVKPGKLQLVDDGQILWRNMAKELVTKDELESELRAQGIEDLSMVHAAYMEPNGTISAITGTDHHDRPRTRPLA